MRGIAELSIQAAAYFEIHPNHSDSILLALPSRISEKGTLQLSIDCDSLKRALADFPKVARSADAVSELPGFSSYIEREMGTVVNTVKVCGRERRCGR